MGPSKDSLSICNWWKGEFTATGELKILIHSHGIFINRAYSPVYRSPAVEYVQKVQ